MIPVAIPLKTVHYDPAARGLWCRSPYPNHPKGCPNFPKCIQERPDFKVIADKYRWYAVVEIFNLADHMQIMKERHPLWTERQCRNPLYWQEGVRAKLRAKAELVAGQRNQYGHYLKNENIILDIPEACGINVFETMEGIGITLERTSPLTVKKVMLVGIPVNASGEGRVDDLLPIMRPVQPYHELRAGILLVRERRDDQPMAPAGGPAMGMPVLLV